ncbi:MAG TPA: DNA recombination protein RmuC [Cytophagales bacterium]|nr:DNA recombination protein RmuC [Cytophagales bacterium]
MEVLFLLIGIALGALGAYLYFRLQSSQNLHLIQAEEKAFESKRIFLENELKKVQVELTSERNKCLKLSSELSKSLSKEGFLQEKMAEQKGALSELQEKFYKEFENLANKIMEEKSEKFSRMNKTNLDEILKPLNERIKDFEKKIEENIKENIERHSSLKEQIFQLNQLNQQISKEANNLSSALKGQVKVQGKWGEIILESILEKSGLTKDREYFVQQSIGQSRPDIVIHLPENKKLIIDAKVSLTAYERFCSEEDDLQKTKFLREHISSIRNHVKGLGEKNYQNLFAAGSPDFILLFIPIEPAFNLAVITDGEIFNEAFEKNIVIVSTSTLLATLRTIASIWRQENQTRNVLKIAKESGELYDKFVGFISDLQSIGKKLADAQSHYDAASNKLHTGRGNLVARAEHIKKLGAKTTKSIPEELLDRELD